MTDQKSYEHKYVRRTDMKDVMGLAAGLVVGGLAGAAVALLLAPQSGEETRAQIRQTGLELRDQTAEAVDSATAQVRGKARQFTTGVKEKAEELQHYGQGLVDDQKERWTPVVEAGQTALAGSQN